MTEVPFRTLNEMNVAAEDKNVWENFVYLYFVRNVLDFSFGGKIWIVEVFHVLSNHEWFCLILYESILNIQLNGSEAYVLNWSFYEVLLSIFWINKSSSKVILFLEYLEYVCSKILFEFVHIDVFKCNNLPKDHF